MSKQLELPNGVTLEKVNAWINDTYYTMSIDSYRFGPPINIVQNVYIRRDYDSKKVYIITQDIDSYSEPVHKESIVAVDEVTDKELLAIYQTFENLERQKSGLETAAQERAEELKLI
jgi:hypothetical protein